MNWNVGERSWKFMLVFGLLLCHFTVFNSPVQGQLFNSGSTGEDGALTFVNPDPILLEVLFDPSTFPTPLDQDGDNVYHFTTINIPNNVKVRLSARILGTRPVYWLAQGDVTIDGMLDLSGEAGQPGGVEPRTPARGGAGGYDGGLGGTALQVPLAGSGPGGGAIASGGGHANPGGNNPGGGGGGGSAYGNSSSLPHLGGSGGGGTTQASGGSSGGAGGGAILIASSTSIFLNSTITVAGGQGGTSGGGGGGGGSGGTIRLIANHMSGAGSLIASGGGATGGGSGSVGRIRVESFNDEFTGTITPQAVRSSPGVVFPPSNYPTLKAATLAGMGIPDNPQDDPENPDLTINATQPVTLEVAATRIPVGTNVQVRILSEELSEQKVDIPLAGTFASSTGQGMINFPLGVSRVYLYAAWDLTKREQEPAFLKEFPDDPIERIETESTESNMIHYHLKSGRSVEVPIGE